jgi:2-(1,2-epoxy-1,2-dihydrophenyl)acetyl-CoA isomerase
MTSQTGAPPILAERTGPTLRITLNRPDARNALDPELAAALVDAIRVASGTDEIRVIVLTGAGSAFSAGARLDGLLAAVEQGDSGPTGAYFGAIEQVYRGLLAARQPTDRAQFGYPEVNLGLAPGMVMVLLFRLVGFRVGLELALTGRRVPAEEAARIGLINRVVPHDELEGAVGQLAERLAALSPSALALIKRAAWTLPNLELSRALEQARDLSTLCALTPDARDGMARFLARGAERGSAPSGQA